MKDIIEIYEGQCDKDSRRFWEMFSKDSKRLCFTEIVNRIRADRKANEAAQIRRIRALVPPERWQKLFAYTKNGKTHELELADAILRRYRKLAAEGTLPLIETSL